MISSARTSSHSRGFTLIESMLAMVILIIAVLGMFTMQTIAAKMNRFGDRMVQASSLATDLSESAKIWPYSDTRLTSLGTVNSLTDSSIVAKWDMGHGTTASYTPEFSDQAGDLGTTYTGLSSDVDRDGTADFNRYWNVWDVDFSGSGTADGKLVQIIVRWKEAGLGYRQITASTFRRNPAKAF